jgi:hypothetical protein
MDIIKWLIILIACFSSPIAFLIITFVEKRLDKTSRFGKWWRRHIVDLEPKDDNTK